MIFHNFHDQNDNTLRMSASAAEKPGCLLHRDSRVILFTIDYLVLRGGLVNALSLIRFQSSSKQVSSQPVSLSRQDLVELV